MKRSNNVHIINRNSIDPLCEIQTDKGKINIEELRDFKKNPILSKLLPVDASHISIAWTSLLPNQVLPIHKHPVDSMIIVCEGQGKYIGEYEYNLVSGDIIYIKNNALHGFQASKKNTLHCLSIQFESRSLYAEKDNILVEFGSKNSYDKFIKNHTVWAEKFSLFSNLIVDDIKKRDSDYKTRLFQCLKRWSTIFQHILFSRQVHTSNKEIYDIFKKHLIEEFGHDDYLSDYTYHFDPKLEGYFSWFINQMSTLPDQGKLIVTNLVLETAADIFYSKFSLLIEKNEKVNDYIILHNLLDQNHSEFGAEHIRKFCFSNQTLANSILDTSWKMFLSMFLRIREISLESSSDCFSFKKEN